jgi:phosphinothricin acetyltransferase
MVEGAPGMQLVSCSHASHARQILDILNDAIVHSTALYDYVPRPFDSMAPWFRAKEEGRFPVVGAVDDGGRLLGFATFGAFRNWPAYKYTVEHSVYVHAEHRGKGVGIALMRALIDAARERQVHVLVGGIDRTNAASIALHEKLGFTWAGTIRHAGFKFGRWLDLAFYQLVLDTPDRPVEG